MFVLGVDDALASPVEQLGQLLVVVLLHEDEEVLPGDLKQHDRLNEHHHERDEVGQVKDVHLAICLSKRIWHSHERVVHARHHLLLVLIVWITRHEANQEDCEYQEVAQENDQVDRAAHFPIA